MRTMVEIYSDVIAVSYYVFFLAIGLLAVVLVFVKIQAFQIL